LFGYLSINCHLCRLAEIEPSIRPPTIIQVETTYFCGTLRLAVVRGYKYKKIRKITGISEGTTQHVRALHRRTGDAVVTLVQRRTVDGRPRILNWFEISVDDLVLPHELILNNVGSFLRVVSTDLMLTELQERLAIHGTCGLEYLQLQFIGRCDDRVSRALA
jgi:hypothetical protein